MTPTAERLHGTWKLVRALAFDADGSELPPPYGPQPMGRLVLDPRGRMMAVLCDGRAQMPAGMQRAYSSYCGNYRIESNRLITTVDAAARPERIGSEQAREFELRGDLLVLRPPRRADGTQRELYWQAAGPA